MKSQNSGTLKKKKEMEKSLPTIISIYIGFTMHFRFLINDSVDNKMWLV